MIGVGIGRARGMIAAITAIAGLADLRRGLAGADALDMMVMAVLGQPDLALETDHLGAVLA